MQGLVFKDQRAAWLQRVRRLEQALSGAGVPHQAERIPHELQSLWREIDFARDKARRRVAKQTTIVQITWAALVLATAGIALVLSQTAPQEAAPSVWLVVLFGLLGGTVSALRTVDFSRLNDRSPIENEAVRLRLRPVLGAAAALVSFVLAGLGLLAIRGTQGTLPIQIQVTDAGQLFWAYCVLGFMAGFSERWFLRLLDSTMSSVPSGTEHTAEAAGTPIVAEKASHTPHV
jgi:hypothetical protein